MISDLIQTETELEQMFAKPASISIVKVTPRLTDAYRRWIEASPFFAIATTGPEGLDCSPRGDSAGFVRVADDSTLLLPERRGNNRLDTLRNIVKDPRVALLFLVPGIAETLRVNGRAVLSRNAELCGSFTVQGKAPQVVIVVSIEAVYFQCARALVRSRLWDPAGFRNPRELPTAGAMLVEASGGNEDGAKYDANLPERLRTTLY